MGVDLTRPIIVLRLWLLTLAALLPLAITGVLNPLQLALQQQMARRPLPALYFLVFVVIGAVLPLLGRLLARRHGQVVRTLNPYLLLLLAQILSEGLLVWAAGRGLGVLVGMLFTLLRLLQLTQLWPLAAGLFWLRALLATQLVLWGLNALQMLVQRWWPLLG